MASSSQQRRAQLKEALESVGCELREDSQLCQYFIKGTGHLSMEEVVKSTREIQFFYQHTDYISKLRSQRYIDLDDNSTESRYWRRREAYRDGEIDNIDDPLFDSDNDSDDFDDREEARRQSAKHHALKDWIRGLPVFAEYVLKSKSSIDIDDVRAIVSASEKASALPDFMIPRVTRLINDMIQARVKKELKKRRTR